MNKSPESKDIKSKKTKCKDKRATNEKIKKVAIDNSKALATRANNKAINSMRYVMQNFPYPIFKTVSSNGVNWPIRVGLTRGGTLTGYERCAMTMCCVTINDTGRGNDGPAQFCRRVQRFLSQPFHVAEQFTGIPGVLVDIKDTIKGFNMIIDGELDHLPEAAFNLKGTIEDAIEAGQKMLAEA